MAAAALVTLSDLTRIQQHLLPHLAACPFCVIEQHFYCRSARRTGYGYMAYLSDFQHGDELHAAFVQDVIAARIKAGGQ